MLKEYFALMFNIFRFRITEISKQDRAGQQYIQGQLDEANHQLKLLEKKLYGSNRNEF